MAKKAKNAKKTGKATKKVAKKTEPAPEICTVR